MDTKNLEERISENLNEIQELLFEASGLSNSLNEKLNENINIEQILEDEANNFFISNENENVNINTASNIDINKIKIVDDYDEENIIDEIVIEENEEEHMNDNNNDNDDDDDVENNFSTMMSSVFDKIMNKNISNTDNNELMGQFNEMFGSMIQKDGNINFDFLSSNIGESNINPNDFSSIFENLDPNLLKNIGSILPNLGNINIMETGEDDLEDFLIEDDNENNENDENNENKDNEDDDEEDEEDDEDDIIIYSDNEDEISDDGIDKNIKNNLLNLNNIIKKLNEFNVNVDDGKNQ